MSVQENERTIITTTADKASLKDWGVAPIPEFMSRILVGEEGIISSVDDIAGSEYVTILQDIPDRQKSHGERLELRNSENDNYGARFSITSKRPYRGYEEAQISVDPISYVPTKNWQEVPRFAWEPEDETQFESLMLPVENGVAYIGGVVDSVLQEEFNTSKNSPYLIEIRGENSQIHYLSDTENKWTTRKAEENIASLIQRANTIVCTDNELLPKILNLVRSEQFDPNKKIVGAYRPHTHKRQGYYHSKFFNESGELLPLDGAPGYPDIDRGNVFETREIHGDPELKNHLNMITTVGREKVWDMISMMEEVHRRKLSVVERSNLQRELLEGERKFLGAQIMSRKLAERSVRDQRHLSSRVAMNNPRMNKDMAWLDNHTPDSAKAWVLDGLVIDTQRGSIKELESEEHGFPHQVNDVLGSATSLNLGSNNPWVKLINSAEGLFGVGDNVCYAYHPGLKQRYGLEKLINLYPSGKQKDIMIHSESSGTAVNSIAVESALAYVDKIRFGLKEGETPEEKAELDRRLQELKEKRQSGEVTMPKLLAIDGTWHGGTGLSREGTGFGTTKHYDLRQDPAWIDRSLPLPTRENLEEFLTIVQEKVESDEAGGIIMESVVGDAGIIEADPELVKQVVNLMSNVDVNGHKINLPIIIDAVQQQGRMEGYWGIEGNQELREYNNLVLTTAKSASNGQPFGFTLMPKEIAQAAFPYSQITTNELNGALLRACIVADIVNDERVRNHVNKVGKMMEEVAEKYGVELRGRGMNRGIYTGNPQMMETAQFSLLINRGILVGALPSTIRFQPGILEDATTVKLLMRSTLDEWKKVERGQVSEDVMKAVNYSRKTTGLNISD